MKAKFKKFYEKIKESFQTATVAAFIVIMVILLLYIPFKIIPKIMTNGTSFIATTISSFFIPNEENIVEENENLPIEEDNTDIEETQTTNTKNVQTENQTPKYYGKADLSISLIGVGIVDKNTGQFYQTDYAGSNDIIGVKFGVKNVGTNISGIWRLRLVMPSKTTPNYDSDYQISLKPGDRIEYVASFEKPLKTGTNTGYVVADYFNNVDESVESNNYLTIPIRIEGKNIDGYSGNTIKMSCGANTKNSTTGKIVTWSATVSGGIGQALYSWTGTDGLLSIDSPYNGVNKIYYNSGTKTAKVSVKIGNQIISGNCGSVFIR
ncbi:MAG: CARDB domain-containing protein [Candidatus Paceibacterota bacterium]|jgi:hypothetical protein